MGAGASIPADAPAVLSLSMVQTFLGEDFDAAKFMLVAEERDGILSVTLEQLLAEIAAQSGSRETKSGEEGKGEEEGKEGGPEGKEGGDSDCEEGDAEGKETTEGDDGDNGAKRGPSKAERRRLRNAKDPEEVVPDLSPAALGMIAALEPKQRLYQATLRAMYVRDLTKLNIKKRQEEAEAKVQAEEDDVAAAAVETKANAYMMMLSVRRREAGWGNWDKIKLEEEEEEEGIEEEEAPDIVDTEAEKKKKEEEEAALLKEKEDMELLALEIKEGKIALTAETEGSQTGMPYRTPLSTLAREFLLAHYAALGDPGRTTESLTPSFAPHAVLSLAPGQPELVGRDEGIAALIKALGGLPVSTSIARLDVQQRGSRPGADLCFNVIASMSIADDKPRMVMEMYHLVYSKEESLPETLVCRRLTVVPRDTRPLYTFATHAPLHTRHDNMEPHVRLLFPPTAEELAEAEAAARAQRRVDMVQQDAESRLFEEEWVRNKAKMEAERAAAEEKERIRKMFADAEEEEDDEEEEEEEEEEENNEADEGDKDD